MMVLPWRRNPYVDVVRSNEDKLDETRSNEAHLRQAAYLQDPCSSQGPCPSKPFEGLEQCLSRHQQVWDYLSRGCPCHRRRCMRFQIEERPQSQVVDGYASHREYPILKPPHTTNQALTRVRDRVQDQAQPYGNDLRFEDYCHTGWFTYMRDIASPTSLWRSACSGTARIDRAPGVPPYSAGMDMRSGGTTSNKDRISGLLHDANTQYMGSDTRQRDPSGIPSTYSASRPLLGRDGQDSEGVMETRPRPVIRGSHADPTIRRTSDHEDSRRLASGLSPDLSGTPGEGSGIGRQTDPGDRRTSDWGSSTWGSHPMDLASTHSSLTAIERDTPGNASRTLMTGLRRPGQRGVTAYGNAGDCREMGNPTAHHNRWLWANLLQEGYPSEGYFMNTMGSRTGIGSWLRPTIALRDIPKRLTRLLSGTDNRRNHSDEVEELQSRAREYTRQQLEQMDDWDRAFYREWTSLISRNALTSPYPLEEPSGSSKVKLRRSRQRRSVATRDISPQARANASSDPTISSPRRQGFSILRGISSHIHTQWKKIGRMGRQHPDRPKLL